MKSVQTIAKGLGRGKKEEKEKRVIKPMCVLAIDERKNLLVESIKNALEKLQNATADSTVHHLPTRLEKIPSRRRAQGTTLVRASRKKSTAARNTLNSVSIFGKKYRKERKKNQYKKTVFFTRKAEQEKKRINGATIYIQSTHNNTIYTLTTEKQVNSSLMHRGGQLTRNWVSAGTCGFKNTRKATSYASQAAAEKIALLAKNHKITEVNIKIKGLGPGKLSGVRSLHQSGLRVGRIWECTSLPHNGCRPPKPRRI